MLSGLGLSEILIILLVTLVVVGPEKIPDIARMLGKGVREVRRASNMFRDMFMLEETSDYRRDDRRKPLGDEDEHGGVAGTVSRADTPPTPDTRPVLLAAPRRATHTTDVILEDAGEAAGYSLEPLSAPSREVVDRAA